MNKMIFSVTVLAAIGGLSLAAAPPALAAPSCAQEMAAVQKDRDTLPQTAPDMSVVDLHIRAAEKAMRTGDNTECLQELDMASIALLPDDHHHEHNR
jgi:hypothetical protein